MATGYRSFKLLLSGVITLSVLLVASSPALASPPVMPMPGERFITPAERAAVRAAMTANEAAEIGHLFEDSNPELVIGYSSAEYAVEKNEDGTLTFSPIGRREANQSAINLPNKMVAASDYQYVAGTSLYISMTVNKTTSSSPYKFYALIYSEWRGGTGMDSGNDSRDHMSVAWSGAPAYTSSTMSSSYYKDSLCSGGAMDVRRDSIHSNGATFSFSEWKNGGHSCRAHWAYMYVYFQETTFKNKSATVAYKYSHTYGGLTYSISISASPGITISPTNEQWPASVGVGYTY